MHEVCNMLYHPSAICGELLCSFLIILLTTLYICILTQTLPAHADIKSPAFNNFAAIYSYYVLVSILASALSSASDIGAGNLPLP